MLRRLASLTIRRRWAVLILSALFVAAATGIGTGVFEVLDTGGFADARRRRGLARSASPRRRPAR
jgi:hypothetical protein